MKKKKNLRLTLLKKTISELSTSTQHRLLGGETYGGSNCNTCEGYSCSGAGGTGTCVVHCNPGTTFGC